MGFQPFKIGQKVRAIKGINSIRVGDILTIKSIPYGISEDVKMTFYRFEENSQTGSYGYRLEAYEEPVKTDKELADEYRAAVLTQRTARLALRERGFELFRGGVQQYRFHPSDDIIEFRKTVTTTEKV